MKSLYLKIEVVDVVLIHCNAVNNTNQQKSRVLFSFLPNSAEFKFIEVWFTDQDNNPVRIEDDINLTLVILEKKTLI